MSRTIFGLVLITAACSSNQPISGTPGGGDTASPGADTVAATDSGDSNGDSQPGGDPAPALRYGLVSGTGALQRFTFDPGAAKLTIVDTQVSTLTNPSFLAFAPGKKVVYVAEEGGNKIHAYTYTDDAKLTELGTAKDSGGGPPYVGTDISGKYVLAANFNEGTVRVFATNDDGSLGDPTANATLGTGAHQMPVHPSKAVAYVPCRDDEHVYFFDFSSGALSNQRNVAIADSAGPRHLVFHPFLNFAYLITEFAGTVIQYPVNSDGSLGTGATPVSLLLTAVSGDIAAAEVAIAPSGKFMYASIRGTSNFIATLAIDPNDGTLTLKTNDSAHGTQPRHFSLDSTGQWLFIANEVTDDMSVFAVNTDTGALTYKSTVSTADDPEFVMLLP